jgi:hypothetical protein
MDIERFFPLLILWVLYQIFFKKRAVTKKESVPKSMPAVGWREARNEDKEPSPVLAAMATVDKDVPAGASNRTVRPRAIVADSVQPAKHYSRRSLRRAVIWSEILGPPVCQRKVE